MNSLKTIIMAIAWLIFTSSAAQATTVFARQYNAQCNMCHIGVPPSLNATGMSFLRNGLRFSKSDETTLQRALSETNRLSPVGFFVGGAYKDAEISAKTPKGIVTKANEVTNPTFNVFLSGSLNENLSTFIGGKYAYMETSPSSNDRSVELLAKSIYLQYNGNETEHVVRGGVFSPYSQLGNIGKSSENSGLSDVLDQFISPLDMANMNIIRGMEYSYLMDNGLMFLVAAGTLDKANSEQNIMAAVNYFNNDDLRIGLVFNRIIETKSDLEKKSYTPSQVILGERTTLMIPLEYNFKYGYFNTAAVYETNSRALTKDYYGLESSVTLPISETGNMRFIHTMDNSDKHGYSLSVNSLIADKILIGITAAKFDTNIADFETVSARINYIF